VSSVGQNGGSPGNAREQHSFVRVGRHAMNHSYSQAFVRFRADPHALPPLPAKRASLNVSIEYATSGPGGRGLDLVVTPQPEAGVNASDFAVAFGGSFAWDRLGHATATAAGLSLQGHGLGAVSLACSAASVSVAGVVPPGGLGHGESCAGGHDCASGRCSCAHCSCHKCSGSAPGCAPGSDDGASPGCGVCAAPASASTLPYCGAALGNGPVGVTSTTTPTPTTSTTTATSTPITTNLSTTTTANLGFTGRPTLASIQQRVAARRLAEEAHDTRFSVGAEGANTTGELAEALTAALSWRHVWTGGAEDGPVLPMTYGFSWITPTKRGASNDWKYILFGWDNIFASYTAAVLGYREAAYSNLIQIVKAKARDGYVPNWAAGGSKTTVAEPAVAGRVLLELYRRFGDSWVVELLFDDLLDWSNWQWTNRRTVSTHQCCDEPGFVTIGNDYGECGQASGNCPGGGESGLDQSPKWDCPGAAGGGSGGDCSVYENKTGLGPNPAHVLQLGDTQSTALFVHDALSLAELALALGPSRAGARALLQQRAALMQGQLRKLWDPEQRFFADVYVQTGAFSTKLTPTAAYPLLARVGTAAQAAATVAHLGNASELCVSAQFATGNPELCYWGLPSVSKADVSFMQPQSYIYWRGNTWGPMSILTYWSLGEFARAAASSEERALVRPMMAALAAQKEAQMMWHWRQHRHICEVKRVVSLAQT
jgi:hypothetical protein